MKVSKYKKDSEFTYALGATVVMEFLNKKIDVVLEVIMHPDFGSEDTINKINAICKERRIPVTIAEKPFNILSQKGNCYVIGVISKKKHQEMKLTEGNHVVLVNPSDAGNMGTIMRSALGFGISQIGIVTPAVDPFDPKTVRASMGAAASVTVELFDSFTEYQKRFPNNKMYPFMLDGSVRLQNTIIEKPCTLIFGNEATGLPADFIKIGQPVRIEHGHEIDSLNLPIAASIALYEATKDSFGK